MVLVNLTSVSPSKSLEKAAGLLHNTNKISHLKKLLLKDIVFHHPNPQSIISALLQSPNLHHMEMDQVNIGLSGLVLSLQNEISKLKELCVLKLVWLDLGKLSEQQFHQLCVTILSLPHVSDLSLDLSSNELSLHHVTVIVDTWEQACSAVKLKELTLSGNSIETGLLPLENIAENIVY